MCTPPDRDGQRSSCPTADPEPPSSAVSTVPNSHFQQCQCHIQQDISPTSNPASPNLLPGLCLWSPTRKNWLWGQTSARDTRTLENLDNPDTPGSTAA